MAGPVSCLAGFQHSRQYGDAIIWLARKPQKRLEERVSQQLAVNAEPTTYVSLTQTQSIVAG